MKNSYKDLSDTFFACFIAFIIGTVFFSFLGNLCLYNFFISGFLTSRFFRSICILASITFIILSLCYSFISKKRIEENLDALNNLYRCSKVNFLSYLKKYFILKIEKQENSEDFKYFINDFKENVESYIKESNKYISLLKNEKYNKISSEKMFSDYLNKIYLGIIEDCIDINQFLDIKHSINSYIYEDKSNYIYSDKEKVYLFKDLFISKLKEEDIQIKKLFN